MKRNKISNKQKIKKKIQKNIFDLQKLNKKKTLNIQNDIDLYQNGIKIEPNDQMSQFYQDDSSQNNNKQINDLVQQPIYENQTSVYLDQIFNQIKKNNSKYVTTMLIDEFGNFILWDDQTSRILDQSESKLKKKSLFDLMIPYSKFRFQQMYGQIIDTDNLYQSHLKFTIYSKDSKQKYHDLLKKHNKQSTKNHDNISDIYYKYLKTLTSVINCVHFPINKESIEILRKAAQEKICHINEFNKVFSQQTSKYFLIQSKQSAYPQPFNYEFMKHKDPIIMKWEQQISEI